MLSDSMSLGRQSRQNTAGIAPATSGSTADVCTPPHVAMMCHKPPRAASHLHLSTAAALQRIECADHQLCAALETLQWLVQGGSGGHAGRVDSTHGRTHSHL